MNLGKVNKFRVYLLLITLFFNAVLSGQEEFTNELNETWTSDLSPLLKVKKIDSLCKRIDPLYGDAPFIHLHRALEFAHENYLNNWIPRLELSLGVAYRRVDDNPPAEKYLTSAYESIEKLGDHLLLAQANKEINYYYLYLTDYEKALKHNLQAIDLYTKLNLNNELAEMYSRLGELMQSTGHVDQVLPNLLKAQELYSESEGNYLQEWNHYRLYQYYFMIEDYQKAEEALNSHVLANSLNPQMDIRSYVSYNRRGIFYLKRKQYDKAKKDLLKAYYQASEQKDSLSIGMTVTELSLLYSLIDQVDSSNHYLNLTESFLKVDSTKKANGLKGIFIPGDLEEIYSFISQAFRRNNLPEKAFTYLKKQQEVKDEIFTQQSNRTIVEMQTKYETEKKEAELIQKQRESYLFLALLGTISLLLLIAIRGYFNKRKQNELLEESNEQKEFLIKEIHHRVKNNLQILSSLLNLQTKYIKDPHAMDAVTEGRNRVQSMGLIHQKLYMGDNLASVKMDDYIEEMMAHLLDSFGINNDVIVSVEADIQPLDVDTAIPLGMIINELGTNALKYAFKKQKKGKIEIRLWVNEDQELCLRLSDNGQGASQPTKNDQSTSFGTDLVKILSAKMKGIVKSESSPNGFATIIRIKEYKMAG